jgi:hypothetical protein
MLVSRNSRLPSNILDQATSHFSAQAIQVFHQDISMVDKFENISGSIIISNSTVSSSFNSNISEQEKTLRDIAAEIQELLIQLEEKSPAADEEEQIAYVNIATKPDVKQRAIAALREGGGKAIDELILDNKYLKIAKAVIKGWIQSNG